MEAFRSIPGFEEWAVTKDGELVDTKTGKRIRRYKYGDYLFCSYPVRGKVNMLLSVHRAVALAWVFNDDPINKTIVNHKDGNPMNNWYQNLEWITYSGNNYHAINTGLRSDAMPCKIRNFHTKEIKEFPSIAQAADYMKLSKSMLLESLRPRKFGKLIAEQYEFRLLDDPEPFFYEDKPYIISPSRYMVEVKESNGSQRYLFKMKDLLQQYQLYGCPYGRSVPALVKYANEKYPDKQFKLRDAYSEVIHTGSRRRVVGSTRHQPVVARNGDKKLEFRSMSEAARHFQVDRDLIKLRIMSPEMTYLGWSFEGKPCFKET